MNIEQQHTEPFHLKIGKTKICTRCINYSIKYKIRAVSIRSLHIKYHADNVHNARFEYPFIRVDFVCDEKLCQLLTNGT